MNGTQESQIIKIMSLKDQCQPGELNQTLAYKVPLPKTKRTRSQKTDWTVEEEWLFCQKHELHGNRWIDIEKYFTTGKTVTEIKNYFYSTVRKIIRLIKSNRITYSQRHCQLTKNITSYFAGYVLKCCLQLQPGSKQNLCKQSRYITRMLNDSQLLPQQIRNY